MNTVFITGISYIGPHGCDFVPLMDAVSIAAPEFPLWPADQNPPSPEVRYGPVERYPKERWFTERQLRLSDRAIAMTTCAVGLALDDAGLGDNFDRDRVVTAFGTARAEHPSTQRFVMPMYQGKPRSLNPALFPMIARNVTCGQVAITFGLRGLSSVLSSGPTASVAALMRAYGFIRQGRADVALVGGIETLSRLSLYLTRHLYDSHFSAPKPAFFDRGAGQIVPAEGSCVLVLESAAHAERRGATPYARIEACLSGNAGNGSPAAALAKGYRRIVEMENGPGWRGIGMVSAAQSGGVQPHDIAEVEALSAEITAAKAWPVITAPRAVTGEAESCAAAAQVAMAAHAIRTGLVTPTWHCGDAPDGLDIARSARRLDTPRALVSATDYTGSHCLVRLAAA